MIRNDMSLFRYRIVLHTGQMSPSELCVIEAVATGGPVLSDDVVPEGFRDMVAATRAR